MSYVLKDRSYLLEVIGALKEEVVALVYLPTSIQSQCSELLALTKMCLTTFAFDRFDRGFSNGKQNIE